MIVIRCSSVDRLLACATSAAPCDAPYNPNTPEAREGTAGHEILARVAEGKETNADGIAAKHAVDADVLRMLDAGGRKILAEIAGVFPAPKAEAKMEREIEEGIYLRGTADLLSEAPGQISVLDWKLGWSPSDHVAQLKSYALLAYLDADTPALDYVTAIEAHVRAGEVRTHRFDVETLMAHRDAIVEQVGQIWKQHGPGVDSCRYCPRQNICKARDQWLRGSAEAIATLPTQGGLASRDLLGSLYERSRQLHAALRSYDAALDAALQAGPVPLGDGRQIVVDEVEQQRLRVSKAMPYLREVMHLRGDEADEALTLTKSGLERVVKARADKGKGAQLMRETMAALQNRGAVEIETVRKKKVEACK